MNKVKSTSYEYGYDYQLEQAKKYRNRMSNHWKIKISLAQKLFEKYALSRIHDKLKNITIVDIGCSIGTFAIEFAKKGYCSYGIDFDSKALEIARQLAKEENVSPKFICGDVANWNNNLPKIDVAICFDIFEHLHDDELGSLLSSLKTKLSTKGCLIFHTWPTQYNYIFYGKKRYPLVPLVNIPSKIFNKIIKIYEHILDIGLIIKKGETFKESLKKDPHCNLMTLERLQDILQRAGYEIIFIESSNLYCSLDSIQKRFARQSISHRNIYGVAIPKSY